MDFQDCISFANENPLCYLATIDETGWPRVRALMLWFADDKGFHFSSHASKALCKQLEENNKVEACFYAAGSSVRLGPMMRVCGETEFLVSLEYKRKLLEERPILKRIYGVEEIDDPGPVIFRIFRGEAHFWTMEYNLRESEMEKIQF